MSATPGPWAFNDDDWTVEAGHHIICEMHGENAEANARLIAAAPTMYEALKAINAMTSPGHRTFDEMIRDMGYACDRARAALAKAEGRE
jgi:hypothetical protein